MKIIGWFPYVFQNTNITIRIRKILEPFNNSSPSYHPTLKFIDSIIVALAAATVPSFSDRGEGQPVDVAGKRLYERNLTHPSLTPLIH